MIRVLLSKLGSFDAQSKKDKAAANILVAFRPGDIYLPRAAGYRGWNIDFRGGHLRNMLGLGNLDTLPAAVPANPPAKRS